MLANICKPVIRAVAPGSMQVPRFAPDPRGVAKVLGRCATFAMRRAPDRAETERELGKRNHALKEEGIAIQAWSGCQQDR